MEFFDKELKAARLLDDFVSSIHEGLGTTKEPAPAKSDCTVLGYPEAPVKMKYMLK
jgi:hypothetical protein